MPTGLKINCSDPSKADIVILCAPYDRTASFRKGAVKGPAAIVSSLKYQMETYDRFAGSMPSPERKISMCELRNLNRRSPSAMVSCVKQEYERYINHGAFVLMIGGEHSVSTGALEALASLNNSREITVCQIDAHLDLRHDDSDYSDSPHGMYAHCTVMRRAVDLGFKCAHVGVRAYAKEEMDFARDNGHKVFEWGISPVPNPEIIVESITTDLVYLTIDVDGIDPAYMPATGTPVQGGLEWYYTFNLLRSLFQNKEIIGADVVEVAPRPFDVLTEYGAAQLCYTILALRETCKK
ncbi:MAG: agmatinase [Dehalococcoidales bacterium]|nr:agmatinase [Dehalococcoidales bacterium]